MTPSRILRPVVVLVAAVGLNACGMIDSDPHRFENLANSVLQSCSYHAVRHLSCEVREHVVILRGRVPSFYLKQIAQTLMLDLLSDSLVIDNRVEVDRT